MNPFWRQQDFIYDINWDSKVDNDFIDYLVFEARNGNFVWTRKISRALVHAIYNLCHNHNQDFSFEYGAKQVDSLMQRHKTFKWMLCLDGVSYDKGTNVVTASNTVWKQILKVNPHLRTSYLISK